MSKSKQFCVKIEESSIAVFEGIHSRKKAMNNGTYTKKKVLEDAIEHYNAFVFDFESPQNHKDKMLESLLETTQKQSKQIELLAGHVHELTGKMAEIIEHQELSERVLLRTSEVSEHINSVGIRILREDNHTLLDQMKKDKEDIIYKTALLSYLSTIVLQAYKDKSEDGFQKSLLLEHFNGLKLDTPTIIGLYKQTESNKKKVEK